MASLIGSVMREVFLDQCDNAHHSSPGGKDVTFSLHKLISSWQSCLLLLRIILFIGVNSSKLVIIDVEKSRK